MESSLLERRKRATLLTEHFLFVQQEDLLFLLGSEIFGPGWWNRKFMSQSYSNFKHSSESEDELSSSDEESTSESEEISPREDQPRHIAALLEILARYGFALDNSPMGSGKTFTTMEIFKRLELKRVIYVGVLSVLDEIKPIFKRFAIPTDNFITFQSLRSMKGKQPKHKLLVREEGKNGEVNFQVTAKMKRYIREGVLLIADETQYVRNDSSIQCRALAELERAIIESGTRSKVLELTGLIGGKMENYINLMQRFRIIRHEQLFQYHKNGNKLELLGAQDLVDFCSNLEAGQTARLLAAYPFTKKTAIHTCFKLYEEIVHNYVTDAMLPALSSVNLDCKHGYYNIAAADACHLTRAIANLEKGAGYNAATEDITPKNRRWRLVTTSLRQIEISKINIFIAAAIRDLETHPSCKVCICLNYSHPVELIAKALHKYGAQILWGKIEGPNRKLIRDKFNEPNLECRVLVVNIRVINCGVRLDDRYGNFPRYVYGSPSFYFNEWHQFTRRFVRGCETQSDVRFRFIYGLVPSLERPIFRALSRHTEICIKASKKQVEHGIKFPGEYEEEVDSQLQVVSHYDIGSILRELELKRRRKYDEDEEVPAPSSPRIKVNPARTQQLAIESSSEEEEEEEEEEPKGRAPRPPPIIQSSPTPRGKSHL